jgi:hypothetical protein
MLFHAAARRLFRIACLIAGATLAAGCDSDADRVCSDVTNCSHGGSDDYLTACRVQNADLSHEATRSACSAEFDAYFACADDHFECQGNKSIFPGCEAKLSALDGCLAAGRANNACGELETELAACPGETPDAGADGNDGGSSIEPCTAEGVCSARCYLDALANVCAPSPAELARFADCASHCVF